MQLSCLYGYPNRRRQNVHREGECDRSIYFPEIALLKKAIALNAGFAKRAIKVEVSERAISSTLVALDLGELSIQAVALSVHHSP